MKIRVNFIISILLLTYCGSASGQYLMADTLAELQSWNRYPTYEIYQQFLEKKAVDYPQIVTLQSIGKTVNSRELYVLKISDNPNDTEMEPRLFLTSTMHGDETTGMILLLRMADYLTTNYYQDTKIKYLVDNFEIYINPNANPDGTYRGGNQTVTGAWRYNGNSVDLNRNYPMPTGNQHPDGNDWQPETVAMMNFMDSINFTMAFNFHGGTEVVNFPWDYTYNRHPDDAWYQSISKEYADTVFKNSALNPGYFKYEYETGYTNGADWYVITGSRQDYANFYNHSKEVTIEVSRNKTPVSSILPDLWNYNYESMLNYILRSEQGISGIVKSKSLGSPVKSVVKILNHDTLGSWVESDSSTGFFIRPLLPGNYLLSVSAAGYFDTIIGVNVDSLAKKLFLGEILLNPDEKSNIIEIAPNQLKIYPNPGVDQFFISGLSIGVNSQIEIYNFSGQLIDLMNSNGTQVIELNSQKYPIGIYIIKIYVNDKVETLRFIKKSLSTK